MIGSGLAVHAEFVVVDVLTCLAGLFVLGGHVEEC